jgi:hypothetical protein
VDRSGEALGCKDERAESDFDRGRNGGGGTRRGDGKHAPFGVCAAASGLLQVGRIGPGPVGFGVKEEGIEIRQPEPTDQEGGEQEQGTKPATMRSDHARTLRKGSGFVYRCCREPPQVPPQVSELVRKCYRIRLPVTGRRPTASTVLDVT